MKSKTSKNCSKFIAGTERTERVRPGSPAGPCPPPAAVLRRHLLVAKGAAPHGEVRPLLAGGFGAVLSPLCVEGAATAGSGSSGLPERLCTDGSRYVQATASRDGGFVGLFNLAMVPVEITITPSSNTPQGTLQTLVPGGSDAIRQLGLLKYL